MSGVKVNSTVPPCLRRTRRRFVSPCNGRAPSRSSQAAQEWYHPPPAAGRSHPMRPSLCAATRILLHHCCLNSCYYSTMRRHCQPFSFPVASATAFENLWKRDIIREMEQESLKAGRRSLKDKRISCTSWKTLLSLDCVRWCAAENQLVLGEIVTDGRSNGITAVQELWDSLNREDSIVTADAMICQKEIVRKIREGKADYVISLKGNQPALLEDISLYFEYFQTSTRNIQCS